MLVQLRRCRPSEPKALSLYSMLVGSICQHAICVTPENKAVESYREHLLTALFKPDADRHLTIWIASKRRVQLTPGVPFQSRTSTNFQGSPIRFICNSPCLSIASSAAGYKTPVLLLLSVSFTSNSPAVKL